ASGKVRDGEDAIASTRGACAPQNSGDRAQFLIAVFGRDNVFVEIQRHCLRGEDRLNRQLVDLAAHYQLPLLATNGVQYARPYGRQAPHGSTCIREHPPLSAAGKLRPHTATTYLTSEA